MKNILKKENLKVLTTLFVSISFFFFSVQVDAASLYFYPSSGTYNIGDTIEVSVMVASAEDPVNAYSGLVSFSGQSLVAKSISTSDSVVDFWVQDPSFSNETGSISFDGVTFNPGFQGVGEKVISVVFEVVAAGTGSLKFSEASVLAHDGAGTNILSSVSPASFLVGEEAPVSVPEFTPEPEPVPSVVIDRVGLPVISSPSHPDPESWYDDNSPEFVWEVPKGVNAVRLVLDRSADFEPFVVYDPPVAEKHLKNIDDGVWYFMAQFKDATGWGEVGVFQVNIDTTPPEEFYIERVDMEDLVETRAAFEFKAKDSISGISYFEIWIDGERIGDWEDDGTGVYITPSLSSGEHEMKVLAYNYSGKSIERTSIFNMEEPREGITLHVGKMKVSHTVIIWLLLIFLLIFVSALVYIQYRERNLDSKHSKE